MAAPSAKLGLLHELFTDYCMNLLRQTDENGKMLLPSAAEAAVVKGFLKDNNVTADPDAVNDVKDVANFARQAMRDAGIDTAEMDLIAEDFQNFAGGRLQ